MDHLADPTAPLTHQDQHVELHARPGATTARDVLEAVLVLFADMGATRAEVAAERARLRTDAAYFDGWCRTLPAWCPGVARYVESD